MSFADRREAIGAVAFSLHTWPRQYGFALVAVVAATVLRFALSGVLGRNLPFLLSYPVIWLVAWLAGFGPGVVVVFLSAVAAEYLLFGPANSSALGLPLNANGVLLFCIAGVAMSALADMYRRRAKRLQEFERAVEGVEDMIAVVDRDYRYVIANRSFLNYRGMKREDVVGRCIPEILNPGVFETTLKEKLDECFRGKIVQYETRYIYPKRGERDLFVSYFPIEGPGGVDRVACVLHDITERKEAEQSLKLFRALIDQSNDAVEVVDPETLLFLDVNEKACMDLGYSREELLAMTVFDVDPNADEACRTAVLDGLRDSGFVIKQSFRRRRDGSIFPVEISIKHVQLDRAYHVVIARDITERKQSEEALREREEKFHQVADNIQEMFWMVDAETKQAIYVNPAFEHITGRTVASLLDSPLSYREIIHSDDRVRVLSRLEEAARTGILNEEFRIVRPDGMIRWVEAHGFPVRNAEGKIYRLAGVVQDITARRQAEEAMRDSEDRYRDLVEHSEDLVCTHDLAGTFLSMNPAPARVLGYRVAELMNRPMQEFIAPEFREQFDAYLDKIRTAGADQGLLCVVARNGERRIWEYNNTLRTEGVASPIIRGIAHDVTERKRAEAALRRSEGDLNRAQAVAHIGSWRFDLQRHSVTFSDETYRITGMPVGASLTPEEVMEIVCPEHHAQVRGEWSAALGSGHFDSECSILVHGVPRWIHTKADVEVDNEGRPVRAVGTVQDITESRMADDAQRRREEDYRRFVAQSSEGIFRQDMDAPVSIALPEDELVHHILYDSYLSECNEAIAKMYGLTVQDLIGKRLTETLDPNDPRNIELTREYIRSGFRVLERESHEVDAHGNPKVFRNSMIGIVENGMLVRTWGIQRDVTEQVRLEEARRRAEKALQESETHFRLLVEQASDGIFISDAQGKYIDVNSAGAEMLGYTRDEMLQLSIPDIVEAEETSRLGPEVARFAGGTIALSEWKFRRKDGSVFPGEVCGKKLPDGRLQGILRDISERREAEEAMRRSEERFRVALKDSPITVFNQDRDLRYTWIYNPQLHWQHDVMGKTDAEIIGAKKAASLMELKRQVLKTGVAVRQDVVIGNNGKSYAFDLTVEPLFDADGSVIGITGAAMDIARLRERTDRLQDARDRLANEKSYLESEIQSELGFEEIIGHSEALREVLKNVRVVAPTDSTVLLLGETGTGKELVARSVHALSSRHDKTFVKLNCAAVPSGLLESELFGHEKGAFTGAVSQKVGRIELADKGTLFLDEIGELPLELQPKLLRVLQDREFERLGGVHTLHVDVRIISATNRDLQQDILDRKFREDLFYRLNVFPIDLPSLRERRSDIPILVHHFVHKHAARMGKRIDVVPDETMKVLQNWNWPGNIRELENMIERMVILSKGQVLAAPPVELEALQEITDDSLTEVAREHIIRVLRETNGVLSGTDGAASRLGLKRTTLQSMLKRHGIEPHEYRRGNGTFGPS